MKREEHGKQREMKASKEKNSYNEGLEYFLPEWLTAIRLREIWLLMLEPPWRIAKYKDFRSILWCINWAWVLAGLVLGAVFAPPLVQLVGLVNFPYQDKLVIGAAVLTGFLIQFLGYIYAYVLLSLSRLEVVRLLFYVLAQPFAGFSLNSDPSLTGLFIVMVVSVLGPLAGVGYALNYYFTSLGPAQSEAVVAFVGGLLIKTFIIPAIASAVQSNAFKALKEWLRGGKTKST